MYASLNYFIILSTWLNRKFWGLHANMIFSSLGTCILVAFSLNSLFYTQALSIETLFSLVFYFSILINKLLVRQIRNRWLMLIVEVRKI